MNFAWTTGPRGRCAWGPEGVASPYRYALYRHLGDETRSVGFVLCNPSTADQEQDDPTIRRLIDYAERWGFGGLWVANVFAYRATDPWDMRVVADPVGPLNDVAIQAVASVSKIVVAGWGLHGRHLKRGDATRWLLAGTGKLHILKSTKDGLPSHPLFLEKALTPFPWVS